MNICIAVTLQILLQTCLVIIKDTMATDEIYFRLHHAQQVGLYDLKALIQVDGTQNRFKSISQNRGTLTPSAQLLALTQLQIVTKMNLLAYSYREPSQTR